MKKGLFCGILIIFLLVGRFPLAAATECTEIHTPEDLQAMGNNPGGSYVLMNDLDMTGFDWTPVDLTGGSFDGNGHAIVNLTVNRVGDTTAITYDGNRTEYETSFAGLFGVMRNASVSNLHLVNVRAVVESEVPCFLGSITGAMYDSQIRDCSVSGCLELRAWNRMFGVGGLAGYGSGRMERCQMDMTLICTDTGRDTLDEQFLGGAYATGYIDVVDCGITLDAYVSEWGYVHNGGIIGMVMQYPLGEGKTGYLTGNAVSGKITFFECNENRRAYCEAYVGETLTSSYSRKNNTADFFRDERWDYSRELRPEMCVDPVYDQTITEPGCDSFGYTEYACRGCGYTYSDHYTLPAHTVTVWTVTEEATTQSEGLSTGCCDGCGVELTRTEPKLEPEPTQAQAPSETTMPEPQPTQAQLPSETTAPETQPEETEPGVLWWIPLAGGVVVLTVALAILLLRPRKKGAFEK